MPSYSSSDVTDMFSVTVSEFLDGINGVLADAPAIIRGEISGISRHPTGVYFSLQDSDKKALLSCYMPPSRTVALFSALEDGMEVRVTGVSSIYKLKGRFSFLVETVVPSGEGAVKRSYQLLKKTLTEEGLFDRKRSFPLCIRRVAVVTSATSAALGDFRKNLYSCGIGIDLYPVSVEGLRAETEIVSVFQRLSVSRYHYDVVVLIRGGGSASDLDVFNTEAVVRAVFACPVPTICAIGHERDVPLVQMVCDAAVSTPTAAAVFINHRWDDCRNTVHDISVRLCDLFQSDCKQVTRAVSRASDVLTASVRLYRHALDRCGDDCIAVWEASFRQHDSFISSAQQFLDGVNPARMLSLGYSITTTASGKVVCSVRDVECGDRLVTIVGDGVIESRVEGDV
jgi:exodeoxyribonuclease VII large subunit